MSYETILILLYIFAITIWLWLNLLASVAVRYDKYLSSFQRKAQMIFVWTVPFIGAGFVLRIVYDHFPNAIPRSWIPFGFRNLIYGKPIPANKNRDDNERKT